MASPTSSNPARPPQASTRPLVLGVVDIGASAIRLVVGQDVPGSHPEVLEEASRAVLLGRDTFSTGRISAATMDAAIRALTGFRALMNWYGVTRVRAVATSAVREAANAETFLDRVRVRTGLDVEMIDGSEESRLTYLAVSDQLDAHAAFAAECALLVEVGGGSVDVTRLASGEPVQAGVYPLGAIRMRQRLGSWHGSHEQRIRLLSGQVENVVGDIVDEIPVSDAAFVVALGGDMRFVAAHLAGEGDQHGVREITRDQFLAFVADVARCDDDDLAARFQLSPVQAETLVPAMLVYRAIVVQTQAARIVVPDVSLRDGLLLDLAGAGTANPADFAPHVLASAMSLGARYKYDAAHAAAVARLATRLFDLLAPEHALGTRDRLLLEVAALLHDIGLFVSLRGHHKHCMYLLAGVRDLRPVARRHAGRRDIARYHRRGVPQKIAPAVHAPRSRRARAGQQAGGHAAAGQRARRRAPAEGHRSLAAGAGRRAGCSSSTGAGT